MSVTVSELAALQYARELSSPGVVVARDGPKVLASTLAGSDTSSLPASGNVTVNGEGYRAIGQTFTGFGTAPVTVTDLSALSATATSLGGGRAVAVVLIVAFLVLAFGFSMLASRAVQGRLTVFLDAARRLGSGDFSSPIKVEGKMTSPRRDPSHRPHFCVEPGSAGAAGARAEDGRRCSARKRETHQRPTGR